MGRTPIMPLRMRLKKTRTVRRSSGEAERYVAPPRSADAAARVAKRGREDREEAIASKRLRLMWRERLHTDAKIHCGGRCWEVHRAVLSAASPVFASMLKCSMREGTMQEVHIQESEPDVINDLLQFAYTGSVHRLKYGTEEAQVVAGSDPEEEEAGEGEEEAGGEDDEPYGEEPAEGDAVLRLLDQASVYQMPDLIRVCCLHLLTARRVNTVNIVQVTKAVRDFKSHSTFHNIVEALECLIQGDVNMVWTLAQHL
mmetsp:Transcript_21320/g.61622  ORF Transcript_21320/g.61622 Transcript_21320/m.61622 type:complete len:256 (-) Transcript_21320:107-874(-)